ncbi:MAG: leucine-rich repeat domain-containing protein [Muribaculaceae bacterium]|nr:leucine-rich repeat domain-containing protein [Muribaculaceae bacterium]
MKINKLLAGLLTVVAANVSHAYDIEVDGICYNIVDGDHLAVTYRGEYVANVGITDNDYAGDITIPDSVDIGSGVILPVKEIGNHALMDSKELHSVKLPPTIVKLGFLTFCRSGIETLDLSETKIIDTNNGMCGECVNLRQVYFPESLRSFGSEAFSGSGIEEMTLPDNIQYIFSECFQGSEIRILTLGEKIYSIGEWAFRGSKIEQINNMERVKQFHYESVAANMIKSITIGTDVRISFSFSCLPNLESVICLNEKPQVLGKATDTFYGSNADCILWVPDEYLEAYASSESVTCFFHDIRPLSQVKLEEATAADSTAMTLYDLNGRRVSDPRPGQICITSDGRKVRF